MSDTRRSFLLAFAGTTALILGRAAVLSGQAKPTGRPVPTDPTQEPESTEPSAPKSPTKALLEANEKDIKKNIEKLYQLATDLKAEVEKTNSSQILSLALVKKAEEIEKLAREIKTRAKG